MKDFFNCLFEVNTSMKCEQNFWNNRSAYMIFDKATGEFDYLVKQENWLVTIDEERFLFLGTLYTSGEFVSACTNHDDEYECEGCEVCDTIHGFETYQI